jgi:hypothetical protein
MEAACMHGVSSKECFAKLHPGITPELALLGPRADTAERIIGNGTPQNRHLFTNQYETSNN